MAATALELALMVARKIIDAELVADPGAARRMIKAAVRRLGDVHKVTLRVSPDDLEALRSAAPTEGGAAGVVASGVGGGGGGGGSAGAANLAAELGVAKVELVADTNLTSGECIVDSDAATVDGRLGTRVEELRRVLEMAIHQESMDQRGPGGGLAS
jgi:flagellar biosynthesis/type III secretory pathway protein FliH